MNSATSVQNTGVKLLAVYSLGSWLTETENGLIKPKYFSVPTKTQLSIFWGTPGEDYFKGNPKGLNFYFLVIWWGKCAVCFGDGTPGLRRFFVKVVQSLRVADRLGFVDAKLPLGVDKVRCGWNVGGVKREWFC